ncbi:hypothetical protein [Bdellovibrio sp. KM01]|uniref:hypothetical protein n=1 Tax=Bdellovibrio sp. KM01 TaxID=2748865 RepID=UPI0015EAAE3C|nr:hypothetical protein [Bdellovibrio sp. KM01]QLY24226.1 hypothetical protein HW988_12215 [Bdellovibrio sp. KM01]
MSIFVELEIQNLLNETSDLDEVAVRLISSLESSPDQISLDNINALARFLNHSGRYLQLAEFVIKNIDNENFPIPWPYFMEALGHATITLDEKIINALIEGIQESEAENEAARSAALNKYSPLLGEWRSNRKYRIHKDFLSNKKNLLDQLITLRTQQLYEQEKVLLARLQKLYPGDSDVANEVREHRQRHALEILARRSPRARDPKPEELSPKDPEVEKVLLILLQSLRDHAEEMPEMAFDFAIAAFMFEGFETALDILQFCENSASVAWFRLEVLLQCRRFIELLNEIAHVELAYAHEPETFFATAYLRAQAMWGIGQKHTAVEILEGLLASRPHYRAGSALLSIWSGGQ